MFRQILLPPFSRTRTSLNTGDYDGIITYSFEVIATNTDTATRNVSLVDSNGVQVASIGVPAGTSNPTRLRTFFAPTVGSQNYRVQTDGSSAANLLSAFDARILVKQVGATQSKLYVPLISQYDSVASNSDNSAGALDSTVQGGVYGQHDVHFYSMWKKNDSAFVQLAGANPFTFEAVISTSVAGSTTGYVSLFNASTNAQVSATELSTTAAAPTLVSVSFSDLAANFTDLKNMEVRIRNDSGFTDNAYIYRSGLWIKLANLTHAQVQYKYSSSLWQGIGSGHDQWDWNTALVDLSLFSSPTSVYHELSGLVDAVGTPCTEQTLDIGQADSGISGSVVAGSSVTFTTTTKTLQASSPLNTISGDRFISDTLPNPGPGNCILIQPHLTVSF